MSGIIYVGDSDIFMFTVVISCGSVQTIFKGIRYFTQLTLFPSVSKTAESDLRHIGTISREHSLQKRAFHFVQFVKLTLMKGDKEVEFIEKRSYFLLFLNRRNKN